MKKVAAIVMALFMVLPMMGTAVAGSYDYTQLEGIEGYKYNKFSKTWAIYDSYLIYDTTVYAGIAIRAEECEGFVIPCLRVASIDAVGNSVWEIEGIDIYIDGVIYSFDSPFHPEGGSGYWFFGYTVNRLIRAMAAAEEEIAVRIRHSDGSPDFDLDWGRYNSSIGRIAKVLVDKGVMDATEENYIFDFYEDLHNPIVR